MIQRRRVHRYSLAAGAALAIVVLAVNAGSLEPPGPPGSPTMLPIDQVDPRIPIYTGDLPLTITEPGSYYLAENIVTTGGGIVLQTGNVTIDLMGFTLSGGIGPGIDGGPHGDIIVRNGTIAGWTGSGVRLSHMAVLEDLHVRSNGNGIEVGFDARIVNCTVTYNSVHGIIADVGSLIQDCVASNNLQNGIWANRCRVVSCVVDNNGRSGIRAEGYSSLIDNQVHENDPLGIEGKAGIWLPGAHNRVEGNTVLGNNIGIHVEGNDNIVVRNVVGDNLVRNFDEDLSATGNYIPVWPVGGSGAPDPWANIEQP